MTASEIDLARRALIEDFLADYADAIDDGDLTRWPDYFTADGCLQSLSKGVRFPPSPFLIEM